VLGILDFRHAAMKLLYAGLLATAAAKSHDLITKQEFATESVGKFVFLDMYADW